MSTQTIAIAVVHYNARYLVGRRAMDVPQAGMWEFPGGKVMAGESGQSAAVRECQEETGLAVQVEQLLNVVEHAYDHGQLQLHFFLCCPLDVTCEPEAPFRWVERDQLLQLTFPPANRTVLDWIAQQRG